MPRSGAACGVALMVAAAAACGAPPPQANSLLQHASEQMARSHGFHFRMQITGATSGSVPVEAASGEAHPPDLHATVDLREGGFLIEVEVTFSGSSIYLKSVTGGWQRLTEVQVAQFFDARTLFDPKVGLFSAMSETQAPTLGARQTVDGHDTYPVSGTVTAVRMHQLLSLIRDQGSYHATYWIESPANTLWRAQLTGNLFDPARTAAVTFDFSNHDHPISVTPPPLG
ncbi:MAG TPA: LppX_LprAFG lipoprotein [Candidatus Dormibacteraeota bacterium]|jgi:lipoprotein LprG